MMGMTTTRMGVGCPMTDSVANKTIKIGDRHEAARLHCASARVMGRFVDISEGQARTRADSGARSWKDRARTYFLPIEPMKLLRSSSWYSSSGGRSSSPRRTFLWLEGTPLTSLSFFATAAPFSSSVVR